MSNGDEQAGMVDTSVLWGIGSDSIFTDEELSESPTEIDPDTGETKFLTLRALTLQEQVFVQTYCKTFDKKKTGTALNITGPAVAGFLARKPVAKAVHDRALAMAKAADMDQKWVLENLREIVERCMGDGTPDTRFDASNALRALELVGKTMAMFVDKTETNINNRTVIRIESNVGQVGQLSGCSSATENATLSATEYAEVVKIEG